MNIRNMVHTIILFALSIIVYLMLNNFAKMILLPARMSNFKLSAFRACTLIALTLVGVTAISTSYRFTARTNTLLGNRLELNHAHFSIEPIACMSLCASTTACDAVVIKPGVYPCNLFSGARLTSVQADLTTERAYTNDVKI